MPDQLFGWLEMPDEVDAIAATLLMPEFVGAEGVQGTGEGKIALLYNAVREVAGGDIVRKQAIGDCVSMGHALAVDVLTCLLAKDGNARWVAEAATEVIYAGSRVEVGGGRISGDGSNGAWAAKWLNEAGAIPRGKYGEWDLTTYSGLRARQWGAPGRGVPDGLEPEVRQHPVKTISRVRSYNECRDALANGYPITFSSDQGFTTRRDEQGFCRASGSWAHCMGVIALDDESSRPGVLIQNSWGTTGCTGPKRHNQPEGSFWCDADTADRICRSADCWAFSGYVGFPAQDLDANLLVPR